MAARNVLQKRVSPQLHPNLNRMQRLLPVRIQLLRPTRDQQLQPNKRRNQLHHPNPKKSTRIQPNTSNHGKSMDTTKMDEMRESNEPKPTQRMDKWSTKPRLLPRLRNLFRKMDTSIRIPGNTNLLSHTTK